MNGPPKTRLLTTDIPLHAPFGTTALVGSLLPGESEEDFNKIREIIISEIAPQSGIEWLWTLDLIEISWDINRYRTLRHKVLEAHRRAEIESALHHLDALGISNFSQSIALQHVKRNVRKD
jgi:hypothetical protein